MIHISDIISEEINNYVNQVITENVKRQIKENAFGEEKKSKKHKDKGIKKNAIKMIGGQRKDFDEKEADKSDPLLPPSETADLTRAAKSGIINIRAAAKALAGPKTKNGKQSELRKKVLHKTNDSGTPYRLRRSEADALYKVIDQNIPR